MGQHTSGVMEAEGRIALANDVFSVEICPDTGRVLQVTNLARDLDLIHHPISGPPWRVELTGDGGSSQWADTFTSFDWTVDDARRRACLRWEHDSGLAVESTVSLPEDDGDVSFAVSVTGVPGITIDKIEYPIITGIGNLHDTADSLLAHSQGTGFLFRRPYDRFEREPLRRQGLRYSPYPEGFNGSTMQFMSYYAEGVGGFLMRAADPTGAMKWLNFYMGDGGALESTFMHQSPDMQAGRGLDVPYPIVIEAMTEGTWYEAADRYKRWAVTQPWTAQGKLVEREDRSTWLLDEVGFATFGVNAAHDRSSWLDRFHSITNAPVFHVLGVNWPKTESGYGRGHPGGRGDWFPARFSQENLDVIERNDDYWAPFEFDLLLDTDKSEREQVQRSLMKLPAEKYSFDRYDFRFQCPASDYLPALHRWRDATLTGEYGADALYYDISANNVLMTCRDPGHGHPVGGGAWMVDAFARMWDETGEAASEAKGTHVPQGAEMISELFIPYLDFYQARAEASPLSAFEADFFRDWIRTGAVEKIPLFTYVYHEYGPVRMDGWGKLSREVGDLWYWVASRVALWGGLFELNYEFSDLEALEGHDDDPAEHYVDLVRRAYAVDPAKVDFVREIATARVGFAKSWLVYGEMLRPLDVATDTMALDYHLYNVHPSRPHHDERGSMQVESVVHAAWRAPDGRIGFFFVNLHPDATDTVTLAIDPDLYGAPPGAPCTLTRIDSDGAKMLDSEAGPMTVFLPLAPRRVTVLVLSW